MVAHREDGELRVGCERPALDDVEGDPEHNYLSLIAGQLVRILYVGSEAESDAEWLYVRTENDHGVAEGWLRKSAVEEDRCIKILRDWPSSVHQDLPEGYLRLALGERVRVLYKGSGATGDKGWYFGATRGGRQGWFPSSLETCQGWMWHRRAGAGQARTGTQLRVAPAGEFSDFMPSGQYCALVPGALVQVMRCEGAWALVHAPKNSCTGWIKMAHLHTYDPGPGAASESLPPRTEVFRICTPSPSPRKTMFRIYTFGFIAERVAQRGIRTALANRGVQKNLHVVSDVRGYSNPSQPRQVGHIGCHPQTVADMQRHRHFSQWLKEIRKNIYEASESYPFEVRIGVYCNHGRHRSVAAAWFLWNCLQEDGCSVEVRHLSSWHGTCMGSPCKECEGLEENVVARNAALAEALRIWGDVS